jgi:hypothetical protein
MADSLAANDYQIAMRAARKVRKVRHAEKIPSINSAPSRDPVDHWSGIRPAAFFQLLPLVLAERPAIIVITELISLAALEAPRRRQIGEPVARQSR